LISSAFLNYLGGFTHDFRAKMMEVFVKECIEKKIPTTAVLTK